MAVPGSRTVTIMEPCPKLKHRHVSARSVTVLFRCHEHFNRLFDLEKQEERGLFGRESADYAGFPFPGEA